MSSPSGQQPASPPAQHQDHQPGMETDMHPRPKSAGPQHTGSGKLQDKVAIITGGDSGIGRAIAIAYAREGADVAIVYLNEHQDALDTKRLVEDEGRRCIVIAGNVGDKEFCRHAVERTVAAFGQVDIVINNAAEQHLQDSIEEITREQLERTLRTTIRQRRCCVYLGR